MKRYLGRTALAVHATLAAAMISTAAGAAELKQIASIPVPGEPLVSFDIGFIPKDSDTYYLADRSNKAIDIFDIKENKFIGRASGFVGVKYKSDGKTIDNERSGPDGVVVFGDQIWAGDGDSTLKIFDRKTYKLLDTVSTGGSKRLDEMILDPKDQLFIGANNADEPPFATIFSTESGHKLIAKVPFPDATDGAEQPDYNPLDGKFYVSIPEVNKNPKTGAVAVIDPKSGKIEKMLPTEGCKANGLAFGPDGNFILGCTAKGKDDMPPVILIMSSKTGALVAKIPDIGGADMVAYSKTNNQYYVGGSNMPGGGVLGVIDASTNKLVQKISLKGASTPHSVAVDEKTGRVFAPGSSVNGGCSCIQVFAPQ